MINIKTKEQCTLPRATYTVSADGKFAMCADFVRIDNVRLGYGYKGGSDPFTDQKAPQEGGVHRLEMYTNWISRARSRTSSGAIPGTCW